MPDTMRQRPPTCYNPCAHPIRHPSHRVRQLLVDCFFFAKPRPPKVKAPSISLFFMGLSLAPQTREPVVERASPTPRAFPGMMGIGGTKSWVRGWCCHGDRAKPVEGRVAVGSRCVFCVWLCLRCVFCGSVLVSSDF